MLIDNLIELVHIASAAVMKMYDQQQEMLGLKEDLSPLTEADIRSHNILTRGLQELTPWPVFSEEAPIDYETRSRWDKYWLIDPLDGTKDFLARNGEFSINIALVCQQMPVQGIIAVPAQNNVYWAELGSGAYKREGMERPDRRIMNRNRGSNLIAAGSRQHTSQETQSFLDRHGIQEMQSYGSALKFCKLAEGLIDVYPRYVNSKEWDTAAGQVIAHEAACKTINIKTNKPLSYNKRDVQNPFFVASRCDLDLL